MQKRGQVTVFIIIGIVLILAVLLLLFARNYSPGDGSIISSSEMVPINNYVDICARSSAHDAVKLIGLQGGYINMPTPSFDSVYTDIAYWYYYGNDVSPSIETMENELSEYINENLPLCIDQLSAFSGMGYSFDFGQISTDVSIKQENVEFDITYPIKITKESQKTEISRFYHNIPVRLGYLHGISKEIVSRHIDDPDWIDASYLLEQDVHFKIYPYEGSRLVYSLRDNITISDAQLDYLFLFANQFS